MENLNVVVLCNAQPELPITIGSKLCTAAGTYIIPGNHNVDMALFEEILDKQNSLSAFHSHKTLLNLRRLERAIEEDQRHFLVLLVHPIDGNDGVNTAPIYMLSRQLARGLKSGK